MIIIGNPFNATWTAIAPTPRDVFRTRQKFAAISINCTIPHGFQGATLQDGILLQLFSRKIGNVLANLSSDSLKEEVDDGNLIKQEEKADKNNEGDAKGSDSDAITGNERHIDDTRTQEIIPFAGKYENGTE